MRVRIFIVACLLALAIPTSAAADTHYVAAGGSDTSNNCTVEASPCATVNHAVTEAVDGDTVRIAEGIYEEAVNTSKTLEFVGIGPGFGEETGATIIRAPDGVNAPGASAFRLFDGGAIRSLRAEGGDGDDSEGLGDPATSGGTAIVLMPSGGETFAIERVEAFGGSAGSGLPFPSGGGGILVDASGSGNQLLADFSAFSNGPGSISSESAATVRGSGLEAGFTSSQFMPADSETFSAGINVEGGAQATVLTGFVFGFIGAAVSDGSLKVRHSQLFGRQAAVLANPGPSGTLAEAFVVDSLALAEGEAALASTIAGSTGSASLTLHGSTIFASGDAPAAASRANATGGPASLTLRNTIARHDPNSEVVTPTDLLADRGSIAADFSNFTTSVAQNGGSVPAPGSANNVTGAPGFDFESGGSSFVLAKDSPLIDRGDPAIVEPGQLALNDEPRSRDGNADCITAPDIGAYEFPPELEPMCLGPEPGPPSGAGPDPNPLITGFGITNRVFAPKGAAASAVKRGTRFNYTLSEPAKVTITIERKARGRKVRRAGKTRCIKPKPRRTKPRCTRFLKAGALTAQQQSGKQSTPFSGRLRGKGLKPGRYRATIVATDSAGQASQPRRVSFRVIKG